MYHAYPEHILPPVFGNLPRECAVDVANMRASIRIWEIFASRIGFAALLGARRNKMIPGTLMGAALEAGSFCAQPIYAAMGCNHIAPDTEFCKPVMPLCTRIAVPGVFRPG